MFSLDFLFASFVLSCGVCMCVLHTLSMGTLSHAWLNKSLPRHQLWVWSGSSGTSLRVHWFQSTCNHFTSSSDCAYTNSSLSLARCCVVLRINAATMQPPYPPQPDISSPSWPPTTVLPMSTPDTSQEKLRPRHLKPYRQEFFKRNCNHKWVIIPLICTTSSILPLTLELYCCLH